MNFSNYIISLFFLFSTICKSQDLDSCVFLHNTVELEYENSEYVKIVDFDNRYHLTFTDGFIADTVYVFNDSLNIEVILTTDESIGVAKTVYFECQMLKNKYLYLVINDILYCIDINHELPIIDIGYYYDKLYCRVSNFYPRRE